MRLLARCVSMCALLAINSLVIAEDSGAVFNVRGQGAVGDGIAKDTEGVQKAIEACAAAGGGTVLFPAGKYLCGSLHLRSNVSLFLDNGATILGSPDTTDYDKVETLDFKNASDVETSFFHFALIWGEDIENIAIAGNGTIDCNRDRRHGPKCIALKRCKRVSIRDVRLMNCPNYNISLLGTDYVDIDGVTILNGYADGIDPDACHYVRIANCHIESNDDAIVPKTSFSLGQHRSTENVTVTNCYLATECTAFKLGTESGGDFKYITVSNCVMSSRDPLHSATAGIGLESVDGAHVEGVTISNCAMHRVDTPIFIRLGMRGRDQDTPTAGTMRNVCIENITADEAAFACAIVGIPGHAIDGVTLSNLRLNFHKGGPFCAAETAVPEYINAYPDADMFEQLPAYGFFIRHVRGLRMTNVDLSLADEFAVNVESEKRRKRREADGLPAPIENSNGHAVVCDDVEDFDLTGFSAATGVDKLPPLRFAHVKDAVLRDCRAPAGASALLECADLASKSVQLLEPALPDGVAAVALKSGAPQNAVHVRMAE